MNSLYNIQSFQNLEFLYFGNNEPVVNLEQVKVKNAFQTIESFTLPKPSSYDISKSPSKNVNEVDVVFKQQAGCHIEHIIENLQPLEAKERNESTKEYEDKDVVLEEYLLYGLIIQDYHIDI